ncbi:recombinase family protein [Macrococcus carouselicus]|uniref:Recombinase family protein n=1 Tax=Macrococcus carouselicus TaxID=69969 RepID=A0A9Q8CMD0_9STAP|nr:recombinase family protein [Macrococcus carouselicus]TDM04081.1 recombinase family protein [Macrococcus carouselicus]
MEKNNFNYEDYYAIEEEKKIKNVAIYARKSRANEGEKDLNNHLIRLKARCDLNEWKYKVYKEIGSGSTLRDRPQMIKLLEDCQEGVYDAVVVVDIDRLSRGKGADLDRILGILKNHNIKIVQESPYDVYDLNNSNHAQMLEMKMFFGNMELMQIKKRHREGKRLAQFMGKWVNGNPPYGYSIDRKTKFLIINEDEAKVIRQLKDLFLEHRNTVKVAEVANKTGLRTRKGNLFDRERVSKILQNETIAGTYVYNKYKGNYKNKDNESYSVTKFEYVDKSEWKRKLDNHPAIITMEEFNLIKQHFVQKSASRNPIKHVHALTGLCITPTGEKYYLKKSQKHVKRPDRLVVDKKDMINSIHYLPVDVEIVEECLYEFFKMMKNKLENLKNYQKSKNEQVKLQQDKLYRLQQEEKRIEKLMNKIDEGFIFEIYTAAQAKKLKEEHTSELAVVKAEINQINNTIFQIENEDDEDYLDNVNFFLKDIKKNTMPNELNEFYSNVFKHIVVSRTNAVDLEIKFVYKDYGAAKYFSQ